MVRGRKEGEGAGILLIHPLLCSVFFSLDLLASCRGFWIPLSSASLIFFTLSSSVGMYHRLRLMMMITMEMMWDAWKSGWGLHFGRITGY